MKHSKSASEAEVSEFIQNLPPDEAEVAARLREIVISACPGVREYFAYDVPHYAFRRRLCCIWPASQAYSGIDKGVNLGFCEGHLLEKTGHYLTFNNRKQVGVITFRRADNINRSIITEILKEALPFST